MMSCAARAFPGTVHPGCRAATPLPEDATLTGAMLTPARDESERPGALRAQALGFAPVAQQADVLQGC